MTKHDETWRADSVGTLWMADAPSNPRSVGASMASFNSDEPGDVERARLAAQAPAMARLLLKVEWEGRDGRCPTCLEGRLEGGHAPNCELAAVLRAAGVLP